MGRRRFAVPSDGRGDQLNVGDIRITPLVDGEIRVRADTSYPNVIDWEPHARWLDHAGGITMPFGAFLVHAGERVALVDTGVGPYPKPQFTAGRLLDDLATHAAAPGDITDVVLTHLHWDHVGWVAVKGEITFPNATYRCHARDWDHFQHEEAARRKLEAIRPRLEMWSGDVTVLPGIDAVLTPGHTPGHTSIVVSSGDERVVILGDAIHCPLQLEDTEIEFIGDVDHALAGRTREWLARRLESSGELAVGPHFDPLMFGRLIRADGVRRWVV